MASATDVSHGPTSVPASTEPTLALVISREQAERLYWAVGHDADDYTRPIFEYLRDYLGHERAIEISIKGRRAFTEEHGV